jgi:hypothetical protein
MVHERVERAIAQMRRGVEAIRPAGLLRLGDEDVTAIATELGINTSLRKLNLNANEIGPMGVATLAEALKVNTALTELEIASNSIGDAGALSLAAVLRVNTTLVALELHSNNIDDTGVTSLAEALEVNMTLTELDLDDNETGKKGSAALKKAATVNPCALAPITPAQRMAFFTGHLRRPSQQSPLTRLPLDMVRRILTQYSVAQGRRVWDRFKMSICLPRGVGIF